MDGGRASWKELEYAHYEISADHPDLASVRPDDGFHLSVLLAYRWWQHYRDHAAPAHVPKLEHLFPRPVVVQDG